IRNQIKVTLPVADLDIFQTVPLFRHREKSLRKEFQLLHMQAQFARPRAENVTLSADNIPDIEQTEQLVVPLADGVLAHIALQPRSILLDVHETGLTHAPYGLDPPGDLDPYFRNQFFRGLLAILRKHLGNRTGEIETLAKGQVTQGFDLAHARRALFKQFVFQRQLVTLLSGNQLL